MANQQHKQQHTQTLQKCSQIGMYATCAGSILRTDIRWSRAHMGGANQTTKRGLIVTMHRHTSMQDGHQALREGITCSSQGSEGVG